MTSDELIAEVQQQIGSLTSNFETTDYTSAVSQAQRDCGWTLPQTSDFRVTWLIERTKRHLINILLTESAHKFKYKQINLQQRFDHYFKIIDKMDKDFIAAQEANVWEFADVEAYKMFGHRADAGFQYDDYGRDTTYNSTNKVIVEP